LEDHISTTQVGKNTGAATTGTGSQPTAESRSVEVDGDRSVYLLFGNAQTDAPVLLCLQHFRGNLDNWDPTLVGRLAKDREVILLARSAFTLPGRALRWRDARSRPIGLLRRCLSDARGVERSNTRGYVVAMSSTTRNRASPDIIRS
jgi:hypothetical protein